MCVSSSSAICLFISLLVFYLLISFSAVLFQQGMEHRCTCYMLAPSYIFLFLSVSNSQRVFLATAARSAWIITPSNRGLPSVHTRGAVVSSAAISHVLTSSTTCHLFPTTCSCSKPALDGMRLRNVFWFPGSTPGTVKSSQMILLPIAFATSGPPSMLPFR